MPRNVIRGSHGLVDCTVGLQVGRVLGDRIACRGGACCAPFKEQINLCRGRASARPFLFSSQNQRAPNLSGPFLFVVCSQSNFNASSQVPAWRELGRRSLRRSAFAKERTKRHPSDESFGLLPVPDRAAL